MKSNIPQSIQNKIGKNLHNVKNHPLEIIKRKIYDYFEDDFKKFDNLNPFVSVKDNFDLLLIPEEHPARRLSNTFYMDDNTVLRTHTSAHQNQILLSGEKKFLVVGDTYRKDQADRTHAPVFHQCEGVCVFGNDIDTDVAIIELQNKLAGLIKSLFSNCEYRFNNDYFPFTNPSFEMEIFFNNQWLEVLGCGIVEPKIMENCGLASKSAYAFGLGLERLCMILFNIDDIRYFWSEDERFMKQFQSGDIVQFQPYSNFPPIVRDLAFWVTPEFHHNDFCEIIREISKDIVEDVSIVDEFTHPKSGRQSKCYRITYRSNDRTLTNEEVNEIQNSINTAVVEKLQVEIR